MANGIIDFLKTTRSKADLTVALAVLREFRECESPEEWLGVPFVAWLKLEQFQEYLEHLAEGKSLAEDTQRCVGMIESGKIQNGRVQDGE